MGNHAVGVALSAAALAAFAGCATTRPGAAPAAHAAARSDLASLNFSNLRVAERFRFRAAEPLLAAEGADASYVTPHEDAARPAKSIASQLAESPSRTPMARVAANLPEGWAEVEAGVFRHTLSGLRCPSRIDLPEESRAFELTDIRGFDKKNLDIGCNYSTGSGADLVLYASFWPQMSIEDSAGGSVEAIMLRFKVKGRLPVSVAEPLAEPGETGPLYDGLEKPEAAAFDVGEMNGVPYKTSLWIVKTQGWHVKARATYPQQDLTAEIVAAVTFAFSHLNVRGKNLEEPVTAGGEV